MNSKSELFHDIRLVFNLRYNKKTRALHGNSVFCRDFGLSQSTQTNFLKDLGNIYRIRISPDDLPEQFNLHQLAEVITKKKNKKATTPWKSAGQFTLFFTLNFPKMDDTTQTTKEKILETVIGILKKQKRFQNLEITEKTHLDRDLKINATETSKFGRGIELSFGIQITSNTMVFLRDMESLVFYIDTQIFKKISDA